MTILLQSWNLELSLGSRSIWHVWCSESMDCSAATLHGAFSRVRPYTELVSLGAFGRRRFPFAPIHSGRRAKAALTLRSYASLVDIQGPLLATGPEGGGVRLSSRR